MATLTKLEDKLGEVMGLARAAEQAATTVRGMVDDDERAQLLERMRDEARETVERCRGVAERIDGKKTAITEKARETRREATEMMSTYLGEDAEALDGFEFLTMAEAGEVGHWEVLGAMASSARDEVVADLVGWAIPIQERHLADARGSSVALAAAEDPNSAS